jgi:hypothetical protein
MQRRAFIDTNVPMYAAGKAHPYTDAEVRQEIFHSFDSRGFVQAQP